MDALDRYTWNSLRTLPEGLAEIVGLHLAAAAAILPDDPAAALAHTQAAARKAARVGIVREAVGVAAYAAGEFGVALTELRAAARISGSAEYLPMMADCERGLGRPERALVLAGSAEVARLDREGRIEMLIVESGARRDLGQDEAAVLCLQVAALDARDGGQWLPRLRYAYADALLNAGRTAQARRWFEKAAAVDTEQTTDALERIDELDGTIFDDVEEVEVQDDGVRRDEVEEDVVEPVNQDEIEASGEVADRVAGRSTTATDDGSSPESPEGRRP